MVLIRKIFKEWGATVGIILFLYFTGLYTDVAALAQRAILSTGLITADTALDNPEYADLDFSLQTLEGEPLSLSDYQGKVIFLNFWATWCPPCIAEMPGIQKLYEDVDKEKIIFVMVSMDKTGEKAQQFINKKGYTFPVFTPLSQIPEGFRSTSIPSTFVVSAEGKIVSKRVGMANYDTKSFKKFLNKEASKVGQ